MVLERLSGSLVLVVAISLACFLDFLRLAFLRMFNRLASYLGYVPKSNPHQDFSRESLSEIAAVEPFTMTSAERIVSLIGAVEYIESFHTGRHCRVRRLARR